MAQPRRSPWLPGRSRRCHRARGKGTFPLADIHNDDARDLVYLIAKSLAFPLSNMYLGNAQNGEVVLAINPMWAERFGVAFPQIDAMQEFLREKGMAKQYWPERLEVLDALPSTPSGKIQKFKLREMSLGLLEKYGYTRT